MMLTSQRSEKPRRWWSGRTKSGSFIKTSAKSDTDPASFCLQPFRGNFIELQWSQTSPNRTPYVGNTSVNSVSGSLWSKTQTEAKGALSFILRQLSRSKALTHHLAVEKMARNETTYGSPEPGPTFRIRLSGPPANKASGPSFRTRSHPARAAPLQPSRSAARPMHRSTARSRRPETRPSKSHFRLSATRAPPLRRRLMASLVLPPAAAF